MAREYRDAVLKSVARDDCARPFRDNRNCFAGGYARSTGFGGHHGEKSRSRADIEHAFAGCGTHDCRCVSIVAWTIVDHREMPGGDDVVVSGAQIFLRLRELGLQRGGAAKNLDSLA